MVYSDGVLRLECPSPGMGPAVMAYRQSFLDRGEGSIYGSRGLHHFDDYGRWLAQVEACQMPGNKVLGAAASLFLARREADGKVVGSIEVRHSLTQALEQLGGHIGYSVAPEERRKGYATRMLRLALAHAGSLGLARVMLDCDKDNEGSRRTILKCGGVFDHAAEVLLRDGTRILSLYFHIPLDKAARRGKAGPCGTI